MREQVGTGEGGPDEEKSVVGDITNRYCIFHYLDWVWVWSLEYFFRFWGFIDGIRCFVQMVAKCSVVRAYTRLDVQKLYTLTHPTHILKFHPCIKIILLKKSRSWTWLSFLTHKQISEPFNAFWNVLRTLQNQCIESKHERLKFK